MIGFFCLLSSVVSALSSRLCLLGSVISFLLSRLCLVGSYLLGSYYLGSALSSRLLHLFSTPLLHLFRTWISCRCFCPDIVNLCLFSKMTRGGWCPKRLLAFTWNRYRFVCCTLFWWHMFCNPNPNPNPNDKPPRVSFTILYQHPMHHTLERMAFSNLNFNFRFNFNRTFNLKMKTEICSVRLHQGKKWQIKGWCACWSTQQTNQDKDQRQGQKGNTTLHYTTLQK